MSLQDDFLRLVLSRHSVQTGPSSHAEATGRALYPWISNWAGAYLADVRFSGSYAKGTAVSGTTDVDLFIALNADTPGTLRDIYWSLFQAAAATGLSPRPQNVSVGAVYQEISVDLVPARVQSGYTQWHSLYRRRRDSWTQTNVAKHIEVVGQSRRTEEIRAIKIWRKLCGLDWPSFYLELTVLAACHGRPVGDLANNVWNSFRYIAENLATARVVDPSNSNNVLSDELTAAEKNPIIAQARHALAQQNWGQIIQ